MIHTPIPITFVGIGAIGLPMASLLAAAGHSVTGVDPFPAAEASAAEAGLAGWVPTISEAPPASVVIVMVATPDQLSKLVDEALGGPAETLAGQTWVLMSTVGPTSVIDAATRLAPAFVQVLDAPVTGGVARAITGDLVIFASGSDDDLAVAEPFLELLGKIRRVGKSVGEGQAIKVVNQHLCSIHIVAAAEALSLARALGLDPALVLELVQGGAAGSWLLSDRGPRMLLGTDAPVTSTINIFVKDSDLVNAAAESVGAAVPLLDIARSRYKAAADAGLGVRDDSRVIETY